MCFFFLPANQRRVSGAASWLLLHLFERWQGLNTEGDRVDVARGRTAYLIVLSWLFPCGNVWIRGVAQMSYALLNECDCDKLGCWTGMTRSQDGNGPVCVWSNPKCLEHKCTYLGLGKCRYLFRWATMWSVLPHRLAITPHTPPLTITVIQAVMWSINYINPLNTSDLNASCLH